MSMRPRVTVNCAMTADGKLASRTRKQLRISSREDMERVKSLRASSDAILVGVGTILADDPHLTVKGFLQRRTRCGSFSTPTAAPRWGEGAGRPGKNPDRHDGRVSSNMARRRGGAMR